MADHVHQVTKPLITLKITPTTYPTIAGALGCLEDVDEGLLGVELLVAVLEIVEVELGAPVLVVVVWRVVLCELGIVELELCGAVVAEVFVRVVVDPRITVASELRGSKPFCETCAHIPPAIFYSS